MSYRFQCYDPEAGTEFLRYGSTQVSTHNAGQYRRHVWTDDEESVEAIEFVDLKTHLTRFKQELQEYD